MSIIGVHRTVHLAKATVCFTKAKPLDHVWLSGTLPFPHGGFLVRASLLHEITDSSDWHTEVQRSCLSR